MKKRIYIFLAFCSISMFSQEGDTPGFELPNYAAKSPEAAAFLKYGEYPVNLSTGLPNISIPLYTIDVGDYKLPITLDYHASGIKVKQEASWVGLGWNVNYGAQIILDVRDGVDQNNPYIDMPITQADIDYYDTNTHAFNSGPILGGDFEKNSSRVRDVFRFSSPTANGTFFIKNYQTNEVVVFPPEAFKVEIGGDRHSTFVVTDPSGNRYRFTTTKEISYREMTHHDNYISAWYVDQIVTPNNDIIDFSYVDDGELIEYSMTQRYELKETIKYKLSTSAMTDRQLSKFLKGERGSTMTKSKKISEITFNGGASKVIFKRLAGRQDLVNGNSKLNILEIRHNGSLINGFTFDHRYFNPTASSYISKRLKLNSIQTLIEGIKHEFIYNDIALPDKGNYSYSQDLYGYFNDKDNTDLVPVTDIAPPFSSPSIQTVGGANRQVNPNVNQAGMLTEIHYPTKGWTKFFYETNDYVGNVTNTSNVIYNGAAQGEGVANKDPAPYLPCAEEENGCGCSEPNKCVIYQNYSFTANGSASIQVVANIVDSTPSGSTSNHHQYGRIRVFQNLESPLYDSHKRYLDFSETITFNNVPSGNWYIQVEAYGEKIKTLFAVTRSQTVTGPQNILGGGQRIASIENYDSNSVLLTKTNYDYTNPLTGKTSGKNVADYPISFIHPGTTDYQFGGGYLVMTKIHHMIASYTRFGTEGNTIAYEYVKEGKVDNLGNDNGYTLYKFNAEGDWYAEPSTFLYSPWKRGKLLEKKIFRRRYSAPGSQPIYDLLQTEINNYHEDYSKFSVMDGFKLKRYKSINIEYDTGYSDWGVPTSVSQAVQFITYTKTIPWTYLKSTTVTENFYNDSNVLAGTVTTNKTFNYNNPNHLQLSSEVTVTSKGETVEKKFYYPGDSYVASEPVVNLLIQKNRIGQPLLTQTYFGSSKVHEQKSIYKDWGNNILMPEILQGAKGSNPLENRIRFIRFDEMGNPLELQQENGTHVCYVWGFNKSKVIAKLENIKYNQIPAALIMAVQDASDDSISGDEPLLINAISNFRAGIAFNDAMVTTYTYQPLVGVKKITDPRGYTMTYNYDTEGRLISVKDEQNNIITENTYRFKN